MMLQKARVSISALGKRDDPAGRRSFVEVLHLVVPKSRLAHGANPVVQFRKVTFAEGDPGRLSGKWV